MGLFQHGTLPQLPTWPVFSMGPRRSTETSQLGTRQKSQPCIVRFAGQPLLMETSILGTLLASLI